MMSKTVYLCRCAQPGQRRMSSFLLIREPIGGQNETFFRAESKKREMSLQTSFKCKFLRILIMFIARET